MGFYTFVCLMTVISIAAAGSTMFRHSKKSSDAFREIKELLGRRDNNIKDTHEPDGTIIINTGNQKCDIYEKYSEMAIYGYNTDTLKDVSLDDCLLACSTSLSLQFTCR